jgi:hypothetical protein
MGDRSNIPIRWWNTWQAVQIGAGLQVVSIVLPLLDLWAFGSIEGHVRRTYPQWDTSEVARDRNAIVAYLVLIGVLGLAGWVSALVAIKRDRRVRAVVTALFAVGMSLLILDAGFSGDAYDLVLPLWLGMTLLTLPAMPGLAAVVAVWTKRSR